jgi:hypothetical protein
VLAFVFLVCLYFFFELSSLKLLSLIYTFQAFWPCLSILSRSFRVIHMLYCVDSCVHTHFFFETGTYIHILFEQSRVHLMSESFNSSQTFWVFGLVFWDLLGPVTLSSLCQLHKSFKLVFLQGKEKKNSFITFCFKLIWVV